MNYQMQTLHLLFICVIAGNLVRGIQLPTDCGKSLNVVSDDSGWRIVGGKIAEPGQWPWQVYLNKTVYFGDLHFYSGCGATIVNKDWILTAAHCVYNELKGTKTTIEAVLGTVDLNNHDSAQARRTIVKIVPHENFDYGSKTNDIALLKMDTSLDFDAKEKHLQPICLSKLSEEILVNCYSTGFGYQDKEMETNDHKLHSVVETVYNMTECQKQFDTVHSDSNICIGGIVNRGTCKGDSGGPFQCHHTQLNQWHQIGLVSYGVPCALDNTPDVLTRVSYFYDWIVKQN